MNKFLLSSSISVTHRATTADDGAPRDGVEKQVVLRLAVVVSVRLVTGAKAPQLADVKVVVAVRAIPDDVAAVPTGVYVPPLAREIRVVLVPG